MSPIASALRTALAERLDAPARAWLDEALGRVATAPGAGLGRSFAAAARALGRAPLGEAAPRLDAGAGLSTDSSAWTCDRAGRVLLLLAAAADGGADTPAAVRACYDTGDVAERAAVLAALAFLPAPASFEPIARDACRTHTQPLFEAVACENPFPARWFDEGAFNQMVLKAVFVGVSLQRIVGLGGRLGADLARMAHDYANERFAAGRPVTPELWPIIGAHPPAGAVARLVGLVEHPDPEHRLGAALGLGRAGDSRAAPFLTDRLKTERDARVRVALDGALHELAGST
jgi:hypothetical protein